MKQHFMQYMYINFSNIIIAINQDVKYSLKKTLFVETLFTIQLLKIAKIRESLWISQIHSYLFAEILTAYSDTVFTLIALAALFFFAGQIALFALQLLKPQFISMTQMLWKLNRDLVIFLAARFIVFQLALINYFILPIALLTFLFCTYYTFEDDGFVAHLLKALQVLGFAIEGAGFRLWEEIFLIVQCCHDAGQLLRFYGLDAAGRLDLPKLTSSFAVLRIIIAFFPISSISIPTLFIILIVPLAIHFHLSLFSLILHHQITMQILKFNQPIDKGFYFKVQTYLQISGLRNPTEKAFFVDQLITLHTLVCDRPNCFCQGAELRLREVNWGSQEVLNIQLKLVVARMIENAFERQIFALLPMSHVILLNSVLNDIQCEHERPALFKSLVREQQIVKYSNASASRWAVESIHALKFKHAVKLALKLHINNQSLDSDLIRDYYKNLDRAVSLLLELSTRKVEILYLLTLNYQSPQYYVLDELAEPLFQKTEALEKILGQLVNENPRSTMIRNLVVIYYHQITNQILKLRDYKNIVRKSDSCSFWSELNRAQASHVVSAWSQDHLLITQHSQLFGKLMEMKEKKNSRSDLIGQPVESIIAGPVKQHHRDFVSRLIQDGQPVLLNKGFNKFFVQTLDGYMKEVQTLVRLGNSMQQLEFMAIFSYYENDSVKVLLDYRGFIISYSFEAGNQLRLNEAIIRLLKQRSNYSGYSKKQLLESTHLLQQNAHFINLRQCIPQLELTSELQNGLILIPKTLLKPKQGDEDRSVLEVKMFKYFLEHPKKCYVFSATFKLEANTHGEGHMHYETLCIYNCKQVRDIDTKMLSLEILMKQVMTFQQVAIQTYMTSYTSYKTLSHNLKVSHSNTASMVESSAKETWNELEFVVEPEDFGHKSLNKTMPIKKFPWDGIKQQYVEVDKIEESSDIPPLFIQQSSIQNSQEFLFSQLNSYRLRQEDTNLLLPSKLDQQVSQKRISHQTEEVYSESDSNEEVQPKELRLQEINIQGLTEIQLRQEVEFIRSRVKNDQKLTAEARAKQKQRGQRAHRQNDIAKDVAIEKHSEQEQASSIYTEETNNNTTLVHHIITNIISTPPHQLTTLYLLSGSIMVILLTLIIVNFLLVSKNYVHMFEDSINQQYPLALLQNVNLMQIGIQKISLMNQLQKADSELETALQFYLEYSAIQYNIHTLDVNFYQDDYHDFLKFLDEQEIVIQQVSSDVDKTVLEQSFKTKYFIVQYMKEVMSTIGETDLGQISTHSMHESIITLNYIKLIDVMLQIIDLTTEEVQDRINIVNDTITEFLVIGLSLGFFLSLCLSYSVYLLLKWRETIVRTYFLFQGLQQAIDELNSQCCMLVQMEDLFYFTYQPKRYDRQSLAQLKQGFQERNTSLKRSFVFKTLCLLTVVLMLIVIYFVSFSLFITIKASEAVDLNSLISKLGMTELAFSTELTVFLSKAISLTNDDYSKTFILDLQDTFDQIAPRLEDAEHFFIYQLPAESHYNGKVDLSNIIGFTNGNMCNFYEEKFSPLDKCETVLDGLLTQGYTRYMAYVYTSLDQWSAEIFDLNNAKESLRIVQSENFEELIKSYTYVFPLLQHIRNLLMEFIDRRTVQALDESITLTSVLTTLIVLFDIFIFSVLLRTFRKLAMNVRRLLLIFTKQQIQKNKHLMQVLSKQVSLN